MTDQVGTIPLSTALSEADPLSLQVLMSSDPEGPEFPERLPLIVRALREQAERFARAEQEGKRVPKSPKTGPSTPVPIAAPSSDLDF